MAVTSIRQLLSALEITAHAEEALAIAKSKRAPRERKEWFIVAWALFTMAEKALDEERRQVH